MLSLCRILGAALALMAPSAGQAGGESLSGRAHEWAPLELTHYLVSWDSELDGTRVVHDLGRARLVFEFTSPAAVLLWQSGAPAPGGPADAVSPAWAVPAAMVFRTGYALEAPWVPVPSGQESCQSAPCDEPNAACSGWCSEVWHCICTEFDPSSSSGSVLRRHKARLDAWKEVFPPQ